MSKLLVLSIIILSIVSCSKGGDERVAEQESIRATEQVNACYVVLGGTLKMVLKIC